MPVPTGCRMSSDLAWSSDDTFVLDGTPFVIAPFAPTPSRADRFVLAKPRWILDTYLQLAPAVRGDASSSSGSRRSGALRSSPISSGPPCSWPPTSRHPSRRSSSSSPTGAYADTARPAFGVDQGDRERLEELARSAFGDDSLDLVIDDASHILGPRLASFATFFPRLRPGGVLVLEDWSHGHTWERARRDHPEQRYGAGISAPTERPPEEGDLSSLVVTLVPTAGYAPEVVADVDVRAGPGGGPG